MANEQEHQIRDVSMLRLHAEQGYGRTSQMMADNAVEINKATSVTLSTVNAKVNQGLIEVDPLQSLSIQKAMTGIDPLTQVAHAGRDAVLSQAINKIGN